MDPDVVKKRLVARDSVVPATEPSISQLSRAYLALQNESGSASVSAHNAFLRELGLLELDFTKIELVVNICKEEIAQYVKLEDDIGKL
mmetsp:Transcript_12579/g.27059  ORF Transcript_12579/g.27059 Transcript_12579/m.27059 type:complete len:88 (+) Transcript_12579:75-338(+)